MAGSARLTLTCLAMGLGLCVMAWLRGGEYRDALARYDALPAEAPRHEYAVVDRHEETLGSGKSRRTHYRLELATRARAPGLPPGFTLEVGPDVYAQARRGDRWPVRLVGGTPHVDPRRSGREYERARTFRRWAVGVGLPAALLLFLNLTGRLDRWL